MKMKRPHRVYLPRQAVELLQLLRAVTRMAEGYVFTSLCRHSVPQRCQAVREFGAPLAAQLAECTAEVAAHRCEADAQRAGDVIGILGALVLRAAMILVGAWLIAQFHWILYVFGAFLLFTGVKMWWAAGQEPDLDNNRPGERAEHSSAPKVRETSRSRARRPRIGGGGAAVSRA